MNRNPSVAHQFYPGNPSILKEMVKGFIAEDEKKGDVLGVISPHAGYIYSGKVAGKVYSRVNIPNNIILLGPNHTGMGERVSIFSSGSWRMPFGDIEINEDLARLIIEHIQDAREDTMAHSREHSLEVQLPFLQYLNPRVKIVPITLMHIDLKGCLEMGKGLAGAVKAYQRLAPASSKQGEVLFVISSDMNHYESQSITKKKDMEAIREILKLNLEGLWETVIKKGISMCGFIPTIVGLKACMELGAKSAELVAHMTSGDASGDYEHVVGYVGVVIR